ncbi:RNA methyltransferase substrate-binding domain-containing protein, partial [Roseiflexus sp.]|uniref:RNA methyltransferase substrate-binding domain-containing protein n=1 Tax=Roseiflexus sp. TaxID=2562120 RepID=UPI00398AFFCC
MITSSANQHVRRIRSLATDRQERRRERMFVLEGVRLVADALESGATLALVLYAPERLQQTSAGSDLLQRLQHLPASYEATPQVIAAAADTVHPQGVVALE